MMLTVLKPEEKCHNCKCWKCDNRELDDIGVCNHPLSTFRWDETGRNDKCFLFSLYDELEEK